MIEPQLGPDTSWGSHLVALTALVSATRGSILEVGTGHWSTPFLHRYAVAAGRRLLSVDEDARWIEQFASMRVCDHQILSVRYDQLVAEASKEKWSVVFLDQSPGWRRAADALRFRENAEFILVHDYSGSEVFDPFQPILDNWAHKQIAGFSPSSLVLGQREIPAFDKMLPMPWEAKSVA